MNINPVQIKELKAIKDTILVSEMVFDERKSAGGIVLVNDDMKSSGIRPRWGRVFALGPDVTDLEIGQYICISHGRWTRGIKINIDGEEVTIRKVDPKDILLVSDEPVNDATLSDKAI